MTKSQPKSEPQHPTERRTSEGKDPYAEGKHIDNPTETQQERADRKSEKRSGDNQPEARTDLKNQ